MRIVHYTDKVRDALHSGYKPAGFLHCAVVEYATSRDDLPLLGYVIYVWDTREVIAYGKARIKNATHGHAESAVGKTAKDSHELLKGSGDVVKDVNDVMAKAGTESLQPALEHTVNDGQVLTKLNSILAGLQDDPGMDAWLKVCRTAYHDVFD